MTLSKKRMLSIIAALSITTIAFIGCGKSEDNVSKTEDRSLTGEIKIDGSSTVFPISEAMAEEFRGSYPKVKVTVGESGTGGGMKKFLNKEIDICDASRAIKDEEKNQAKENGIEYVELKVAFDGITVVVNKNNDWATDMTVEELNKVWKEGSTVKTWKDVRPEWPNEPIKLYSPGTASGTFEYFTEAINKKAKSSRQDITPSEDDNVLVQGVAGDKNGMAYFGYSYFEGNKAKLNEVKIEGKEPTYESIKDGTYKPLSRPLYLYVNKSAISRPEVKEFLNFYLKNATTIVPESKYIPLPENDYSSQLDKIK